MLRILYDDFDQKVKNIHDEMDLHHSYKKKSVYFDYYISIAFNSNMLEYENSCKKNALSLLLLLCVLSKRNQ